MIKTIYSHLCFILFFCAYAQEYTANEQKEYIAHPQKEIAHSYATRALAGEHVFLLPIKPGDHVSFSSIFTSQNCMKYFGAGKTQTLAEIEKINTDRAYRTLLNKESFTWTLYTHDGIVGRINIFKSDDRMEIAFCVVPEQNGKSLARRGSECIIRFMPDDMQWIATVHPLNFASTKSLETIKKQDGSYVFFKDETRQSVEKYGQVRDYFLSQ
ncbi:MAG: hypothetical protein CNLJKLNK_00034 [Holosporales bacterium]